MPARRRDLVLLCVATLAQFTSAGMLLAALPLYVSGELDGSRAVVGVAVGSFSITAVLLRPSAGRRVDALGRRPFLVGGPVLFLASELALLGAGALWAVVALRLVQGAAGAAFYTAAATAATDLAPPHRRATVISRFSLFLYSGFAIGPALAEAVVSRWGFGAAWVTAAAFSAVAAAVATVLPETAPPARLPAAGAADAAGDGSGRPSRWRRAVHPAAVGPGLVLLTTAVGYSAVVTFSPLYAHRVGLGSSGALYACFAASVITVRLVSGGLADRFGRIAVALPGILLAATGMAVLAAVPTAAGAFVGVGAFGAGFAGVFPSLLALTVDRVDDSERGAALGSYTAFFDVGSAVGGYLVGSIADVAGFGAAWAAPSLCCLAGAVGLVRLRGGALRTSRDGDVDSAGPPLPEPAGT